MRVTIGDEYIYTNLIFNSLTRTRKDLVVEPDLAESSTFSDDIKTSIGAGPFKFVSDTADDRLVMARHDGYFGPTAQPARFRQPGRARAVTAQPAPTRLSRHDTACQYRPRPTGGPVPHMTFDSGERPWMSP